LFDVLGREILTLSEGKQEPGTYQVTLNASTLPSGAYFYRLDTDMFSETKKLVVIK
jgi:hypothetical protein